MPKSKKAKKPSFSAADILAKLAAQREDGVLCDVELEVEGERLSAHRALLAAMSPYFKALFDGAFKERDQKVVKIEGITYMGLEAVIDFCYTAKLEVNIASFEDVLETANFLQIKEALDKCISFMKQDLDNRTCFIMLRLAEKYSDNTDFEELVLLINEYICSHFKSIWKDDFGFNRMSKDAVVQLLSNPELNTGGDESEVFWAIKWWLQCDENRTKYSDELLRIVRFKIIEPNKLFDISKEEIVNNSKEAREKVSAALLYHSKIFEKPFINDIESEPRGKKGYFMIEGGENRQDSWEISTENKIRMYSVEGLRLEESVMDSKFLNGSISVVRISNFLFLFATDNDTYQPVAMRYDASNGKWLKLAPVPRTGTVKSHAAQVGKDIYLLGGMQVDKHSNPYEPDPECLTSDVFQYKIASNEWGKMNDAPYCAFWNASTGCHVNSCVYLSGGAFFEIQDDMMQVLHKVYAFDTKARLWLTKPCLNHPRSMHRMEAVGQQIFVLGGFSDSVDPVLEIEVHDILSEQWTDIKRQQLNRRKACSVVQDENIIIFGGVDSTNPEDDQTRLEHVKILDTKTGKLSTQTSTWPIGGSTVSLLILPQLLIPTEFSMRHFGH